MTTDIARPAPARRASRAPRSRRSHLQPTGLPWILPALVLCVGVLYFSIGYTGVISTWSWDGISPDPEHVGARNFTQVFQDPIFWGAIEHTVLFYVVTFVVQTFLGLLFAVLLHSRIRLKVVYKVIVFVPVVLAPAIMAPVFRQIFAPDGQLNVVLDQFFLMLLGEQ